MTMAISSNLEKIKNWNRLERVQEIGNAYIYLFFQAIEEQKRRFELQEKAINALKHEYESQIERLKKEHNSRLQEGMICIHCFNK